MKKRARGRKGPGLPGCSPAAPAGRKQFGGRSPAKRGSAMLRRVRAGTHGHADPLRCAAGPLGFANGETLRSRSGPGQDSIVPRRFRKDHTLLGRYVQLRGLRAATREGGRPDALAARRRSARSDCGKRRRRGRGDLDAPDTRCARYAGKDQARRLLGATQRRRDETLFLVAPPQNESVWKAPWARPRMRGERLGATETRCR